MPDHPREEHAVGASAGSMFFPWMIGQLFEPVGAWTSMGIIFAVLAAALVVFGVMMARVRNKA